MALTLQVLEGSFSIHRLAPDNAISDQVYQGPFYSVTRTGEEVSVVCSSSVCLGSGRSEGGWSCMKIAGPLDFSLTGVLAEISSVLARAGISIFAISTFDTDYILVKSEKLPAAQDALREAGYTFEN